MTQKQLYDKLFKEPNNQLVGHKIIINTDIIVDASITDILRKPKGVKKYKAVEDRKEISNENNLLYERPT